MVGASFALALRATKLRVLLIESVPPDSAAQPSFDERTTALGNGSRQIFESLGVWQAMSAESAPIRSIHVSDAGRFGVARLDAREQGVHAFGYVVPNRVIGRVLWQALRESSNVTLAMPAQLKERDIARRWRAAGRRRRMASRNRFAPRSPWLPTAPDRCCAPARASRLPVEDYDQVAIVVNAATERPNNGEAFERFTSSGPLAVLPVTGGGYAVIWAVRTARAAELMALDEAAFAAGIAQCVRLARGPLDAHRAAQYLPAHAVTRRRDRRRDAWCSSAMPRRRCIRSRARVSISACAMRRPLAEMLAKAAPDADFSPMADELLAEVRRVARRGPQRRHAIHRQPRETIRQRHARGFGLVRNFGLLLFDLSPAAKRALSRVSWGFAGRMPRLARGLPLE